MRLELEYRQGNKYGITLDNKKQIVSEDELKQLITNIPASERNCKISNNIIGMKSGYGNMPIKRLISSVNNSKIIKVFTNDSYKNYFDKENTILNINFYFMKNLLTILKNLNELDRYYIKRIDKAEVISVYGKLFIRSDDGTTTLDNLSTGCKTCILDNHFKKKLINLGFCGANALETLFGVINSRGSQNSFLLHHSGFEPSEKYNIRINNQQLGSLFDLWMTIAEEGANRSDEI